MNRKSAIKKSVSVGFRTGDMEGVPMKCHKSTSPRHRKNPSSKCHNTMGDYVAIGYEIRREVTNNVECFINWSYLFYWGVKRRRKKGDFRAISGKTLFTAEGKSKFDRGDADEFPHLWRILALLSVAAQQTVDARLAFRRHGLRASLSGVGGRLDERLVSPGGSGFGIRFGLVQPFFHRREQAGHLRPSPMVASGRFSHVLADVDGKAGEGIAPPPGKGSEMTAAGKRFRVFQIAF